MQAAPFPVPAPAKASIHWLLAVTCVVVILAAFGEAFATLREIAAGMASIAKPGTMENYANTNATAAHVTFTNLSNTTLFQCVKGVVSTTDKRKREESVPVCSGEVKPHSTVVLEAQYKAGAIQAICSGKADQFGNRQLDWDLCEFELQPVTGPSTGTP